MAAVWAVAGDSDWADDDGNGPEGFLENMMATAFVGIAVSKSITLAELRPDAMTIPGVGGSKDLGLSVDFGYGYGWQLETSFNGVDSSTAQSVSVANDQCSASCQVDEGLRGHKCSSNSDCQGVRTCSSWGWCQGADSGNACCEGVSAASCYDWAPCKSCKITC